MNEVVRTPLPFFNGDGGTGKIAPIILEKIFKDFPTINIPLTVDKRINTTDACIYKAAELILKVGTGFKNSTASADPRIKAAGMKSANIIMRPLLGCYAIVRIIFEAIDYDKICGTIRYGHGGFYDEQSCDIHMIDGVETAVIVTHLNLEDLKPYAELALKLSKELGLDLILSSKYTIAESEALFKERVEIVWADDKQIQGWSHKLTDMAIAGLPIKTALGGSKRGNFLHAADNPNGDISGDSIDHQNGGFVMGSDVYCIHKGKNFTYFELPGGTADGYLDGTLQGRNFLNPNSLIIGLCSAFEVLNPKDKEFFDAVKLAASSYIKEVPKADHHTIEMIDYVAEKTKHLTDSGVLT